MLVPQTFKVAVLRPWVLATWRMTGTWITPRADTQNWRELEDQIFDPVALLCIDVESLSNRLWT
jgi:hypothetical protein